MPTQVQFRRGTTAQNNNFTGAAGEISVDLDLHQLRVHDGITPGGFGALGVAGTATNAITATNAVNLVGGTTGDIPYQDSTGVTRFINIGGVGEILSSDGSTATWVTLGSLTGGGGLNADNVMVSTQTSGDRYLVVADTNGDYVGLEANTITNALIYNLATGLTINSTLTVSQSIVPSGANVDIGSVANPIRSLYISSNTLYIGTISLKDSGGTLSVGTQNIVTTATFGSYVATTATGIAGGTAGALLYQTGPGTTGFTSGNVGDILVGGTLTPTYTNTISIYVGFADKGNNIIGGTAGQLVYQTGAGATSFAGPGTAGQLLMSDGTNAPIYTNTSSIYVGNAAVANILNAGNTSTQLVGFADQAGAILSANTGTAYVGNAAVANTLNAGNTSTQQVGFADQAGKLLDANTTTQQVGFADQAGKLLASTTGTLYVGFANKGNNIIGGTAGQLVYQSGVDTTTFVGPGTAGQLLMSDGTNAPIYTNTSSIYVGNAAVANTLNAGNTSTQLVGFAATAGAILAANTGTTYVGNAAVANTLNAGNTSTQLVGFAATAGAILAANTATTKVGFADQAGKLLAANTGTAYVGNAAVANTLNAGNTSTQLVGFAATAGYANTFNTSTLVTTAVTALNAAGTATNATNLAGGATGSLPYQSAPDITTFLSIGGNNTVLTSNGSAPVWSTALSLSGNLTIGGNLTVSGTTTYVNSTVTNIVDPIITIGGAANGQPAPSDDNKDRGIAFQWYSGGAAKTGFFGFDDSTGFFTFVPDATISGNEVISGFKGAMNVDIVGGSAGQLLYQSAANTTNFVGPGTAGEILVSAGAAIPVYTSTGSIYVGNAAVANILNPGNTSTQLVGFATTAGKLLAANTTTQQVGFADVTGKILAANTGTAYVGNAAVANILNPGNTSTQLVGFADQAGKLLDANTTTQQVGFADQAGKLLDANTTTQQVGFADQAGKLLAANTTTQYVGFANKGNNIIGGTAGQLVYQSGADTTTFAGPGTAGQLLISGGTAGPVYQSTLTVVGGTVNITSITASLSTASGALQVRGGVGIGGDLYVGGKISHTGLIPTAGTAIDQVYTTTKSLTLTDVWQDTGIASTDLAIGSYMVQVMANDSGVGGGQVNMYYTGVMTWYSGSTTENAYSEIILHRAGATSTAGTIFLRTAEVSLGTLKLQISGTTINSGASNYAFSFRRMI